MAFFTLIFCFVIIFSYICSEYKYQSMDLNNELTNKDKTLLISELLKNGNISMELLDEVKGKFRRDNHFYPNLISVDDETVISLSDIVHSSAHQIDPESQVDVVSYSEWREKTAASFAFSYDQERFMRSTNLSTLCRKVSEHQHYSFVAHKLEGENNEIVFKYDFSTIDADAHFILAIQQEITHSLEHDVLTGGLNRAGLIRELRSKFQTITGPDQCFLVYFNIQNFKMINELHGEENGDKVLQFMYTSMVYSDLHPISYARIESDNFICLVRKENLDMDVISKLCHLEYPEEQLSIPFRCLCGIYSVPDKYETPINACNRAKLAISYIKDSYRQPWMMFDASMQKSYLSDNEILKQLDAAIENKEFVAYYQPIVNTQTGRIEMAEALVRWMSPTKGMIPPGVFIPVLEHHGGLSRIDMVMENCVFNLQRKRYQEGLPIVPVDINLSWVDFADKDLLDQLYSHIQDESLPTDMMCYEITETALADIAENRYDVLDFFKVQYFDVSSYIFEEVYISDVNAELINTYKVIRDNCEELISSLRIMQETYLPLNEEERRAYFGEMRTRFNYLKTDTENNQIETAALFIFLNRTCFNGLYRVNSKNEFNVPVGRYKNPAILNEQNLKNISAALKNVRIICGDFRESLSFIDENTFVYLDPPYRPLSVTASFTSYAKDEFDDESQKALAEFVREIDAKGARILLSNSDPKNTCPEDNFFDDLYAGFSIKRISASRMINSKAEKRGKINELLISNYYGE